MANLLQVFMDRVYILFMLSTCVVAGIIYILDVCSPFGRYKLGTSSKTESSPTLGSAFWFTLGVLVRRSTGKGRLINAFLPVTHNSTKAFKRKIFKAYGKLN